MHGAGQPAACQVFVALACQAAHAEASCVGLQALFKRGMSLNVISPPYLLDVAPIFEKVFILCFNTSCLGQVERWPAPLQSRVELVDGLVVDKQLRIGPNKGHHYRVALTFANIAREQLAKYETILLLEADFVEMERDPIRPLQPLSRPRQSPQQASKTAEQVAATSKYLASEPWSVLRLGYDIYYWHADDQKSNSVKGASWLDSSGKCRSECRCARIPSLPWVCPIGSTVATAFHRRARQALSSYGYGMQYGFISDQSRTNVDNWISFTFTPVHYMVPARIVQNQAHRVTHHSGTKNARVLLNHTPEVAAENMQRHARDCISTSAGQSKRHRLLTELRIDPDMSSHHNRCAKAKDVTRAHRREGHLATDSRFDQSFLALACHFLR
eukprot:6181542-Pleurochrysis_carterae.AAC.2